MCQKIKVAMRLYRDDPEAMSAKKDENNEAFDLAMVEEIFRRYNASLAVELHAPLAKKSNDSKILARLAKIEKKIRQRAKSLKI